MNYKLVTHFDLQNWNEFGEKWIDFSKENNLKCVFFGLNLTPEIRSKIIDAGIEFRNVKDASSRLKDIADLGENCLVTRMNVFPKVDFSFKADEFICGFTDRSIFDILAPINNIKRRAKTLLILEERIKFERFLSSNWIFGNSDFWRDFSDFQNHISSIQGNDFQPFLDISQNCDDLFINMYASFFSTFKVRIGQ